MFHIVLPSLLGLLAGLVLNPLVRRIGLGLGLVDRPDQRKIHSRPTPRIGGVGIYLAGLIGALPFVQDDLRTNGMLLAGTVVFIVGLLDDILDLPAKVKLAGQIVGGSLLLAAGIRIQFLTDFISGSGVLPLGMLAVPLTLLWVIGLTNTVNLIDGVDGLAGGVVLIALTTLLAVRISIPGVQDLELMRNVLVISAALIGSLIGFLRFNIFPASIFMGDSGAYFLGFITAALSVAGAAKGSILLALVIPVIAFGMPIADVLFAIVRRGIARKPIFQADRGHLHHRLLQLGFTQRDTTRFLWMVSACFGLLALLVSGLPHRGMTHLMALALIGMILVTAGFFFDRLRRRRGSRPASAGHSGHGRLGVTTGAASSEPAAAPTVPASAAGSSESPGPGADDVGEKSGASARPLPAAPASDGGGDPA